MAYITKEEVKVIRQNIKKVFPTKDGWKFSIRLENYSTVILNIMVSPKEFGFEGHKSVNQFYIKEHYEGKQQEALTKMNEILSAEHWDESDIQSDYFDCAYYIRMSIGQWDKDCVVKS